MNKLYIIIIVFLLIGGLMIKCSLDTDFSETKDRKTFMKAVGNWFKQLGISSKNTAKYAIKEQEWLPTNDTIEDAKVTDEKQQNLNTSQDPNSTR